MHSSHQPRFELYQNRIFAKSQPYTVEQKLAVAEIRGYTNCQWRVRFSGSLLFQLFRANSKSQQNIICKIMRNETAEAKKGTWKGRRRCTPGQRHKEEAKPGAIPTFQGTGGRSMYIKSFSQPTNPGSRQGRTGLQGGRRKRGGGKPALKLPASFRLTDSCTFLLAPPRGSSPPQKTAFCSFSPKKSSLTHSPLSTASCKQPGQVSRHYHRTGAGCLSKGQRRRQPRAGMKLGEEMESVSP